MRVVLVCFFIALGVLFFSKNILAHEDLGMPQVTGPQVNEAVGEITPLRFAAGSNLAYLVRIKESITHFFKPSSAKKAEYDLRIAGKRLNEAYILTNEKKSSKAVGSSKSYKKLMDRMAHEFEKARSQNQDIAGLIGTTADVLKYHEVLLAKMYSISDEDENYYNAMADSIKSFKQTVIVINKIQPGLSDRFESVKNLKPKETEEPKESQSTPSVYFSPSPSPRKIIY